MSTKNPEDYNVRAVERALLILNCFDDDHPERGISEIAEAVGLHKATAHRIVTTLVNYNFLERADDGQKYRLGMALTGLGMKVIQRTDLRQEALPYLTGLNQRFDETCDLAIFDQGHVLYLEVIQSSHALNIAASVGQRLPAYSSASGKLFLAYLPKEELEEYLKRSFKSLTKNTIISSEQLKKQLGEIREKGYALDNEETEIGIRAVAAPIFGRDGKVIGAISVPGPTTRFSLKEITSLSKPVIEAAQSISVRMGYQK